MQNFITNMKKTIFASLLLIIATILAGCDKKMEPNTQNILGLWVITVPLKSGIVL